MAPETIVIPAKAALILAVISAKAEIQDVNGVARQARELKSYVRVAPPLHPGLPFFARAKKGNRKKARPGAAEYPLRFSPESALASTRRALNNPPRAQTRGSLLPIPAAMLGGGYGSESHTNSTFLQDKGMLEILITF